MPFTLASPAFDAGTDIAAVYTCEGKDISPPLSWSGVPSGTHSLALIVDDPDAPDPAAPKRIFTHWVMYNLPPSAQKLDENVQPDALPSGTRHGLNGWEKTGYGGPCPPIGRHRYFFKLYALDTMLPDLGHPSRVQLEKAMQGHIVGQAELIGLYQKKK